MSYWRELAKDGSALTRLAKVMADAARKAGKKLLEMQPQVKEIKKPEKDFLTDADLASEEIILETLGEAYDPIRIPFLSEEAGGEETDDGLFVIDPLDGTVNYSIQDDHWGVSIGFVTETDRTTKTGVIYIPSKDLLFAACAAVPHTWCIDGKVKITTPRVNDKSDLSRSQVWVDPYGVVDEKFALRILRKLRNHTLYPQTRICCTTGLMAVATGKIVGYIHTSPTPFDIAAGCLIIEKAGGKVTDLKGKPWTAFSKSIVATNGRVHDKLLDIIKNN